MAYLRKQAKGELTAGDIEGSRWRGDPQPGTAPITLNASANFNAELVIEGRGRGYVTAAQNKGRRWRDWPYPG